MSRARGLTIALAGGAGSGKSTIANVIAARLDGVVSSFGDYVRHLAVQMDEPTDRFTLQRIGQQRVEADAAGFVRAFLDWTSPVDGIPLIIDGVRHTVVDEALRGWAATCGREYLLIMLHASVRVRAERRHDGDQSEIEKIDALPVERETADKLPAIAELIVDADGTPDQVVARIIATVPEGIANRLM